MRNKFILVILCLLIEKLTLLLFSGILFVVFYLYFGSTMTEPQNQIETYAPLVRAGLYALLLSPIGVLLGYGLTGMAGTKLATRLNVTKKQVDTVRTTLAVIFLLPSAILLILTLL